MKFPIPEILDWTLLDSAGRTTALARPALDRGGLESKTAGILATVRREGDAALRNYTREFDGVSIDALEIEASRVGEAWKQVDKDLLKAMDNAANRIRAFHLATAPQAVTVETAKGLTCQTRYLPISPAGLYVPGGSAPLISTVLMLAIPAVLAGCEEIILCSPPDRDGNLNPALLAAADRCGVKRVFRIGGAQAIAAMAFGTDSVPPCAKLFGPGNAWVTEAKRQVAASPGGPAQDLPAGPSEVLVIAASQADPVAVAWDLLSQAEHGPDSQALLLSDDSELLNATMARVIEQAASQPRSDVLQQSLGNLRLIKADSLQQCVEISNNYAPEHLIINSSNAAMLLEQVTAAGSVFLGPWTPESLGDYSSGTNHVLPTYGYARAYSGLGVADFQRRMTVQEADPEGLREAGADAMKMAAAEGLEAHRMAIAWRLQNLLELES